MSNVFELVNKTVSDIMQNEYMSNIYELANAPTLDFSKNCDYKDYLDDILQLGGYQAITHNDPASKTALENIYKELIHDKLKRVWCFCRTNNFLTIDDLAYKDKYDFNKLLDVLARKWELTKNKPFDSAYVLVDSDFAMIDMRYL